MWKSNERVPGSWLSHLSSPGRNYGAWQLLHFPPSRPNGAGKFKDFVGSSYVKLRCFFINSNPNRQIRTQQWSFIKYNYDALISFPDVTLLNLFPSQNRLLVVPIRGEENQSSPGGFRTCTAHWGHQFSQSLIESGNCYWTSTGRIFRSTSSKGWIPFHC